MAKRKKLTFEEKVKLALQRQKLLDRLAARKLESLKERVAYVLNHYPEARNSNITLSIRYYEVFHADEIRDGWIRLESFYDLPKMYDMQRSRAMIQNDYGLFLATEEVRQRRMQLAEEARQEFGGHREDLLPTISVYSDESGKDGNYTVIGTIWFYNANRTVELDNVLRQWKEVTPDCPDEFKFNELTYGILPLAKEFFSLAVQQTDTIGFKAVAIEAGDAQLNHDELVYRLYYETMMRGMEFETSRSRFRLPRVVFLYKDEDVESDALWRAEFERKLDQDCQNYLKGVRISGITTLDSQRHELLQVTDLFSASVSRVLNRDPRGKRNQKDEFAEYVCEALSIAPDSLEVNPGVDWVMTHVFAE